MNRREFVNWMSAGAIAVSLPVAIAACTPKSDSSQTTNNKTGPDETTTDSAASSEFVLVGTTAELVQQGYISNENALSEPVVVIEDPANAEGLIALSAKCTHTGCTVSWQEDLFACPCHGSKFNPDGSVVEGPASQPLAQYSAKLEGDNVLVAAT